METSGSGKDDPTSAPIPKKLIAAAKNYIAAKVILFSACQDNQQTAGIDNVRKLRLSFVPEGTKGGACTSLFLQVLYHEYKLKQEHERRIGSISSDTNGESNNNKTISKSPPSMTYGTILTHMQQVCERNGYAQVPLLSSSRPLQINKDPFQIVPDKFSKQSRQGTKRALIIGINYTNSPYALPGCHNDCRNVIAFLKQVHSFEDEHITLLLDDPVACDELHQPTKKNLLRTFRNFAMQCQEGDAVFIHYAGHGINVEDQSGDEPDGYDEALMPVDYMSAGEIIDDEIFRLLLIPMPKNVTVTALFDCCHSGTILDLPFEYSIDKPECDYDSVKFPHMHMVKDYRNQVRQVKKTQDLQDPRSKTIRSRSPSKHRPRGRSNATGAKKRLSKSLEPSIYRRQPTSEENERQKMPEPCKSSVDHQKPRSLQQTADQAPLYPEKKRTLKGSARSLIQAWRKVVSTPVGRPPKASTKAKIKKKKVGVSSETISKQKRGVPAPASSPQRNGRDTERNPRENSLSRQKHSRSRSPRRRSRSQPVPVKSPEEMIRRATRSKTPKKLKFHTVADSPPTTRKDPVKSPNEKSPRRKLKTAGCPKGKDSSSDSPMNKSIQRTPVTQQKRRVSRSLPPSAGRKELKRSPRPQSKTNNQSNAFHKSPRSPRRGRYATTFEPPRPGMSPPKTIEIPVL
jgi:metacaspase-1